MIKCFQKLCCGVFWQIRKFLGLIVATKAKALSLLKDHLLVPAHNEMKMSVMLFGPLQMKYNDQQG